MGNISLRRKTMNDEIKRISISSSQNVANQYSLTNIADSGDAPEFARDVADTFLSELVSAYPHIAENKNYETFREDLADGLLSEMNDIFYEAITADVDTPRTILADYAAGAIENALSNFSISLEDPE